MIKQSKIPKDSSDIARIKTSVMSFICVPLLIFLFSCQQRKDFILNDEDIRYLANEHSANHVGRFPKFMIDLDKYERILISKYLVDSSENQSINVFEVNPEKDYSEIVSIKDRLSLPGNTGVIPYENGDFFVFDIDNFSATHLFLIFDVPTGDKTPSWPCGFEMEIYDKNAFSKQS